MKHRIAGNRSPNWAFMESFTVPHYDDPKQTYLWRLRIVQTPLFGIYLHRLGTPDPRDTLHDHPWPFLSLVLRGGYTEFVRGRTTYAEPRRVRVLNVKRLRDAHWISELDRTPTWTLMFVGRRQRVWGYWDRDGTFTEYDLHPFNDEFQRALAEQGDAA